MGKYSKDEVKRRCTSISAWELPKQKGAIAPDYVWVSIVMGRRGPNVVHSHD